MEHLAVRQVLWKTHQPPRSFAAHIVLRTQMFSALILISTNIATPPEAVVRTLAALVPASSFGQSAGEVERCFQNPAACSTGRLPWSMPMTSMAGTPTCRWPPTCDRRRARILIDAISLLLHARFVAVGVMRDDHVTRRLCIRAYTHAHLPTGKGRLKHRATVPCYKRGQRSDFVRVEVLREA